MSGMTLDWRDNLAVGDVVYEEGDHRRPRLVRKVSKKKNGEVHSVAFSILRCSWTHRPYTVLCRSDLATRGFTPAHCRITSESRLDKRLNAALLNHEDRRMTCCDVVGVCR